MSETSNMLKELVEANGDNVAMGEPPCVLWKVEHKNCKGCEYGLGCGKLVKMMANMVLSATYKPNDFEDFQKLEGRISELNELTLKAKTVEELHAIPMV